ASSPRPVRARAAGRPDTGIATWPGCWERLPSWPDEATRFLGERYRRIRRRRGKKKAIVAVGRSMLVVIWHLLSEPDARFHDLGADHYARSVNTEARKRNHVRQLEALGYRVTLEPAA